MSDLLEKVGYPDDIKDMCIDELEKLAAEIREFLIEKVSETGGHLASNLGVVELTLGIHKVFDTPKDKIIWDVGHQAYVHKVLTGRKERFGTLRQFGGLSGFPKSRESEYDAFNTGHSSTSISAALGMAKARDIKGEKNFVVAVIGDGALTGGMAFEALNNAGRMRSNFIVILNDNEMSISRNVGGMSRYLSKIRSRPLYFRMKGDIRSFLGRIPVVGNRAIKILDRLKYAIKYMLVPGIIFEELGFTYLGPVDGHNLKELTKILKGAKALDKPVLIHICTQKGRGYQHAENKPHLYHGISAFEITTGEVVAPKNDSYSDVFGMCLSKIAEERPNVVAVTAAMKHGTGLDEFSKRFPNRLFDVGIAEQHAVTFAAGLAKEGMLPIVAIYSSFLQRAYDQILHDVALQNLHVIFAVDRAGIVGEDGETHHGIYDISFLRHMPNMAIMACSDYTELEKMLRYAILDHDGPIAIRYPRGAGVKLLSESSGSRVELAKGVVVKTGDNITIIAEGSILGEALKLFAILKERGISAEVINSRFIKPLPKEIIINSVAKTGRVVTMENNVIAGGLGSSVLELLNQQKLCTKIKIFGFPDEIISHGHQNELMKAYGMTAEAILPDVLGMISA